MDIGSKLNDIKDYVKSSDSEADIIFATKEYKEFLKDSYCDWVYSLKPWRSFLTLTFEEDKAPDVAVSILKRLIQRLNTDTFGNHYTRIVKHSYFSYVYGMEMQVREVVHFHMLVDRPIDFDKIHKLWEEWAGFAYINKIRNRQDAVKYICKYMTKQGGELEIYLANKWYQPIKRPYWWIEEQDLMM